MARAGRHPTLSPGWRIFLAASGSILTLVGIAGLALPGIQGILTMALGIALLTLASQRAYRLVRSAFRGWPRGWRRFVAVRQRILRRLSRPPRASAHPAGAPGDPRPAETSDPDRNTEP